MYMPRVSTVSAGYLLDCTGRTNVGPATRTPEDKQQVVSGGSDTVTSTKGGRGTYPWIRLSKERPMRKVAPYWGSEGGSCRKPCLSNIARDGDEDRTANVYGL